MRETARRITLDEWDRRYAALRAGGLCEPAYGGPLGRHVADGNSRLLKLRMDNSPAALRLWNFLLSEEQRLHQARKDGKRLVGTMKDLGTVPVMAYSLDDTVAFYADGAWWLPCLMENRTGMLELADHLGIDDSFCPVRAMLGAFVSKAHFPLPDLATCSVGATCDDMAVIAQRLAALGFDIFWWEMPHRRPPDPGEPAVTLPGGFSAPQSQVDLVRTELDRVRRALESLTGQTLTDGRLAEGIGRANRVRSVLADLRELAYTARRCPMPALEMLIAEMLAIHFCSDQAEARAGPGGTAGGSAGPGAGRRGPAGGVGRAGLLGQSGCRSAGHESLGGRRWADVRHGVSLLPRLGSDSRRLAAHGGPGAHGPGRSDGRLAGRSGRADRQRRAAIRCRGGRHLADPRRQPLCLGRQPDW